MTKALIQRGAFLAAAAGAVHIIVVVAVEGLTLSALTSALAASIVFALVIAAGPVPRAASVRSDDHKRDAADVVSHLLKASTFFALVLIAILVVLCSITAIFGRVADFYSSPAVPWRIEIALFGAFVISILKYLANRLHYANALDMLICLSLFWIAPFYGFFPHPTFSGSTLWCPVQTDTW
jgi:hypothetical protein